MQSVGGRRLRGYPADSTFQRFPALECNIGEAPAPRWMRNVVCVDGPLGHGDGRPRGIAGARGRPLDPRQAQGCLPHLSSATSALCPSDRSKKCGTSVAGARRRPHPDPGPGPGRPRLCVPFRPGRPGRHPAVRRLVTRRVQAERSSPTFDLISCSSHGGQGAVAGACRSAVKICKRLGVQPDRRGAATQAQLQMTFPSSGFGCWMNRSTSSSCRTLQSIMHSAGGLRRTSAAAPSRTGRHALRDRLRTDWLGH